ncbi:SRPBCC family protein [Candidatus Palauibacter irciniicola]|uniref:SRPBCC family protein n=1 Tax=Candidatus Palauibacter irciniicola TaxID=3056733 RepID=UPI003B02BF8B
MNRTLKRIVIGMLVVIAGLFAVVYGVGSSLPQDHVAAVRAGFSASPEEIFATIADYRAYPEWRPSIERVEELPARDGNPAWVMLDATGPLPMELTESEPPTRLVTTILSEGMPFGGRWIYEIEPAAGGATVTVTEEGEVYSAVFRFVSRYIMGHHASASLFLTDLGGRFGEDVTVDVVR